MVAKGAKYDKAEVNRDEIQAQRAGSWLDSGDSGPGSCSSSFKALIDLFRIFLKKITC